MKKHALLLLLIGFLISNKANAQEYSEWTIKKLSINSTENDYLPFYEDSILYFSSSRRNPLEDKLLENSEKAYYVSIKDSTARIRKISYKLNSDANSPLIGLNKDYMFFYRNYFPNNGEIFFAERIDIEGQGKQMKKFKQILSDFDENSIHVIGDSTFFTSNRSGNYEIYLQIGHSKAEPIDVLNSPYDEKGVWISPSGNELYFQSNRNGNWSVFVSIKNNGEWDAPKQMDYPINTEESNTVDIRIYNDTLGFFASDRVGGVGEYDIYILTRERVQPESSNNDSIVSPPENEIPVLEENIPIEQLDPSTINIPDEITPRQRLVKKLIELGVDTVRAEIQLGAYQRYLTSIELFKQRFKCIENEELRMDVINNHQKYPLRKFIIDRIFDDIDQAIDKQIEIIEKDCFPTSPLGVIPFIAILKNQQRYAIFWSKKTNKKEEEFWIILNGKEIWHSNDTP